LFGHEKGAYTGAVARKAGKFEEANKGTLFLDEIAELDLSLQSKLLRVLQERELVRVGGTERVVLDVRIVIASHKNLAEEVKKGLFREDLYYRLIGLPIELPPLRDRGNDIILLATHFIAEFCKSNKMPLPTLTSEAKERLMGYGYPGNVRELKAVMDLSVVMCEGDEITANDLRFNAVSTAELIYNEEKSLREYTVDIIKSYLKKYDNNVIKVADKLDVGKSTIYKMIQTKEIVV
jgi:DNA-binding NtrC family response regulator